METKTYFYGVMQEVSAGFSLSGKREAAFTPDGFKFFTEKLCAKFGEGVVAHPYRDEGCSRQTDFEIYLIEKKERYSPDEAFKYQGWLETDDYDEHCDIDHRKLMDQIEQIAQRVMKMQEDTNIDWHTPDRNAEPVTTEAEPIDLKAAKGELISKYGIPKNRKSQNGWVFVSEYAENDRNTVNALKTARSRSRNAGMAILDEQNNIEFGWCKTRKKFWIKVGDYDVWYHVES